METYSSADMSSSNAFLPILEEIKADSIQQNDLDLLRTEEDMEFYHNVCSREEIEKSRRRLTLGNIVIDKSMFLNRKSEFENYANCSGSDGHDEKENRKDVQQPNQDGVSRSIFMW